MSEEEEWSEAPEEKGIVGPTCSWNESVGEGRRERKEKGESENETFQVYRGLLFSLQTITLSIRFIIKNFQRETETCQAFASNLAQFRACISQPRFYRPCSLRTMRPLLV